MKLTELFKTGKFVITCEVGPPKGTNIENFINNADLLKDYVDAINVTDNQRSVMRISSLAMCHILKERGITPILQITARDRNRLAVQSDLLGAYVLGIENVLLLTGDHPLLGDHPSAKPVYDLDSISLLYVAQRLKNGLDLAGNKLDGAPDFCIGCAVTPGAEPLELQLIKLRKKIEAGAEFIQTQTIYEPKKFETFIHAVKEFNVPILLGHVMIKSAKMAHFMNEHLPGVTVPQEIINTLENTSKEECIKRSIQISINLLKELKPMCQGIHIMPMGWEKYVPEILSQIN